jgi:hypothetical protein
MVFIIQKWCVRSTSIDTRSSSLTRNSHKQWRVSCKVRHFVDGILYTTCTTASGSHAHGQLSTITSRRSLFFTKAPLDRFIPTSGHSITCPKLFVRDLGRVPFLHLTGTHSLPGRTVHPAIGDAIDEDGSGYLSVTEVDQFFQNKPNGWSSSEWIA